MNNRRKYIYYLILLLIVWNTPIQASQRKLTEPTISDRSLATELKILSEWYRVNFLYEEATIAQKTTHLDVKEFYNQGLESVLTKLLKPAMLSWYQIDANNYTIFPEGEKNVGHTPSLNSNAPAEILIRDTLSGPVVSGKVLREENKPQEFAVVTLLKTADSSVVANMITDTLGNYKFTLVKPGNYLIRVSSVGYKKAFSKSFELTATKAVNIEPIVMSISQHTLNTVNIVAKRPLVERKSDRFIINVENSVMASGNSIQLLKTAPFVTVSPTDDISLQGKKTMILIDGKPVPNVAIKDVLKMLPAGDISKFELITNPSSKYDAAYGAVINIVTKQRKVEGITGNVRIEGAQGIYGRYNMNGGLTFKHDKLTIYGLGGFNKETSLYYDGIDKTLSSGGTPDFIKDIGRSVSVNRTYNFQGGVDFDISKHQKLGALVNGNITPGKSLSRSSDAFSKLGGPVDSISYTNSPATKRSSTFNYNLSYQFLSDSNKNELNVIATLTPYHVRSNQHFPPIILGSNNDTVRVPTPFNTSSDIRINVFTSQADFSHQFSHQWKMESGLKYQYTDSKSTLKYFEYVDGQYVDQSTISSDNRLYENIFGGYGVLTKNWNKDLMQFGIRLENTAARSVGNFNQNYLKLFPSLLLQHTFSNNNSIALSYKRTINRAPYEQLVPYTNYINQYTIYVGNPLLKPEIDDIFSLSSKIGSLNLIMTYSHNSNIFAGVPILQNYETKATYFSIINLNRSNVLNFDAQYSVTVTPWWSSDNYGTLFGYIKAEGKVLDKSFDLSSRYFNLNSNNLFKIGKNIKFEFDAYYYSAHSQNLTRAGGFYNCDAAIMFNLLKDKGEIRLSGNQLLKRNIYTFDQNFTIFKEHESQYMDSRNVVLSLTYRFGKTKTQAADKKLGNDDAVRRF